MNRRRTKINPFSIDQTPEARLLLEWSVHNSLLMTTALGLSVVRKELIWVPVFNLLSLLLFVLKSRKNQIPLWRLANGITGSRWIIIALTVLNIQFISQLMAFILLGLTLLLDGLDGWVARYRKEANATGALFDKTTDAFYVLMLSMLLVFQYSLNHWLLGIGLLPYCYELLLYSLNWQDLKISPNPVGRYIAFFLFVALLTPFILPVCFYQTFIILASILVTASFGISFYMKWQASRK